MHEFEHVCALALLRCYLESDEPVVKFRFAVEYLGIQLKADSIPQKYVTNPWLTRSWCVIFEGGC